MADDLNGSGMKRVLLLAKDGHRLDGMTLCTTTSCQRVRQSKFLTARTRPTYAKVFDAAGNARRLAIVYRTGNCEIRVPETENYFKYECFRIDQRCGTVRSRYDWGVRDLACEQISGRGYRVKRKS